MMKRKMAVAMAGAMMTTAVAPAFVNAAGSERVVTENRTNINDAKALAALREELKGYFDTKFTEDTTLLADALNAGKSVYTVSVNGEEIKNVAEFDAYVNDLAEDAEFKLTVVDKGFQKNSDGKIVDCETFTYANLDANHDGKPDLDGVGGTLNGEVDASEITKKLTDDLAKATQTFIAFFGHQEVTKTAGEFVNIAGTKVTANGRLTTEIGDNDVIYDITKDSKVLDFTKPIIETRDVTNQAGDTFKNQRVLIGFENAKTDLATGGTLDKLIIVENREVATSGTVEAKDLYSEGRLTTKGNQLVQALNKQLTNAKGDFLIATPNSNNTDFDITNNKHNEATGTGATYQNSLMYKYSVSELENTTSNNVKVVLTISAASGYKYEKGMLPTDEKDLFHLTVQGTRSEVEELVNTVVNYKDKVSTTYYGMDINADTTLYAGDDRYKTAVEVSKKWENSKELVLVSGEVVADGLAATPLAAVLDGKTGEKGAPILLTSNDKLPMEVKREIKRLGVEKVYIAGGLISDDVVAELEDMDKAVERVAGDDRFATSLEIAKKIDELSTRAGMSSIEVDNVYIAGGFAEADTLSISALAGQEKTPIILTPQAGLTDAQVKFLKDEKLTRTGTAIVGGKTSVSEKVEEQLEDMNVRAKRFAGKDRQHTNALVMNEYADTTTDDALNAADIDELYVVKSDNKGFVDALSAGAVASKGYTNGAKDMVVIATDNLSADQKLALGKLDKDTTKTDKVKVTKKFQIGNGIADAVIKAINSIVTK